VGRLNIEAQATDWYFEDDRVSHRG
jgi:hypothetical protein